MDEFASRSSARLFLAAVPDAGTAARIHQLAGVLKRAHHFDGKLMAPERLHISLFALGGLPEGQLCAVWEAATSTYRPDGMRSAEAEVLDALPDGDIRAAMASLLAFCSS